MTTIPTEEVVEVTEKAGENLLEQENIDRIQTARNILSKAINNTTYNNKAVYNLIEVQTDLESIVSEVKSNDSNK